jgi:pimeloyl-ACP methyl ester carboxylesterase
MTAPVVLVAHSYGGFVATVVAATEPGIAGVVLVDANLAPFSPTSNASGSTRRTGRSSQHSSRQPRSWRAS